MGWTPVNEVTIIRDVHKREYIVKWVDDVTGKHEKQFSEQEEAVEFALKEFKSLAM